MNYDIVRLIEPKVLFDLVTTYAVTKDEAFEIKTDMELLEGQLN